MTAAELIRRHDRIHAVFQRTPSANTAERCRLRLASLGRQARENFDAAWARSVESGIAARQTDDPTRASLENAEMSHANPKNH